MGSSSGNGRKQEAAAHLLNRLNEEEVVEQVKRITCNN